MEETNNLFQQSIEVKTPVGFKIICYKRIIFVEAEGKFSIVYLDDCTTVITYHLLKWYNNTLLKPCFFRCHNSFIVNCRFVDCYNYKEILLDMNKRIPLARNRRRSFIENLRYFEAIIN
jgi:two-component system, LytTR family, response regulator